MSAAPKIESSASSQSVTYVDWSDTATFLLIFLLLLLLLQLVVVLLFSSFIFSMSSPSYQ